ncbi:MAG: Squalene--hopene cyclase [Planctomycetota bacterium]
MNRAPTDSVAGLIAEDLRRKLHDSYQQARQDLWAQYEGSHWSGQLSTSALSTATAISALSIVTKSLSQYLQPAERSLDFEVQTRQYRNLIQRGATWLLDHQNTDGGFGDTDRSHSNIATTLLVLAAWKLADFDQIAGEKCQGATKRAWEYVEQQGKWAGLKRRYGKDKTFVVPILTNCALAGLVPWNQVAALPFEMAALPQSWYRFVRLPVVSYAIPALVAIGQAKFFHDRPRNPMIRYIRSLAIEPSRKVLQKMQPHSGGYLEAVPLTSFVLMSLASIGCHQHAVAKKAIQFILDSVLEDGSWPIDTNLATWCTSLSLLSLHREQQPQDDANAVQSGSLSDDRFKLYPKEAPPTQTSTGELPQETIQWLLNCQHRTRHPFTGAEPGGWGWTNLSGAVPDSDDTPAALLALRSIFDLQKHRMSPAAQNEILAAVKLGIAWLLNLQNSDGGWPTFCRGWGTLPFDRSGTDLTAHALRALDAWTCPSNLNLLSLSTAQQRRIERANQRGLRYLLKHQRPDGSWLPLWFGNQDDSAEDNPIYGTSKVLLALSETRYCRSVGSAQQASKSGLQFLLSSQNDDGGWGGGPSVPYKIPQTVQSPDIRSSVEETALAIEALLSHGSTPLGDQSIMRGLIWLSEAVDRGYHQLSWPIGFYFAKLWYYEKLYPLIFSVSALGMGKRKGWF